jgi:hypothetical protein
MSNLQAALLIWVENPAQQYTGEFQDEVERLAEVL